MKAPPHKTEQTTEKARAHRDKFEIAGPRRDLERRKPLQPMSVAMRRAMRSRPISDTSCSLPASLATTVRTSQYGLPQRGRERGLARLPGIRMLGCLCREHGHYPVRSLFNALVRSAWKAFVTRTRMVSGFPTEAFSG